MKVELQLQLSVRQWSPWDHCWLAPQLAHAQWFWQKLPVSAAATTGTVCHMCCRLARVAAAASSSSTGLRSKYQALRQPLEPVLERAIERFRHSPRPVRPTTSREQREGRHAEHFVPLFYTLTQASWQEDLENLLQGAKLDFSLASLRDRKQLERPYTLFPEEGELVRGGTKFYTKAEQYLGHTFVDWVRLTVTATWRAQGER